MLRELIVPLAIIGIVASVLLPVPPGLMDFLLVGSIILSLVLLISTFYVSEPLKLSSLPSMLLLATLYRLALNISSTRLVLGSGDAGRVIEAFGTIVIQGNLVVGAVVFLIITLVQFIVIAKGSERVAEVSARFTLDALPGKQMSIDADVRAGLIGAEEARRKRQDLQTESRFYGALDGAMKFVKGDAIAGIVIALVNVSGGFCVGMLMKNMELGDALSKYTLLTIGDGLCSQIPALLNSLAAGMIVTRVERGDGGSLAGELLSQLMQVQKVKILIGGLSVIIGLSPGMPLLPFLALAIVLFASSALSRTKVPKAKEGSQNQTQFRPKTPPLLQIEIGKRLAKRLFQVGSIGEPVERFRIGIYERHGLILLPPDLTLAEDLENSFRVLMRGVLVKKCEIAEEADNMIGTILSELEMLIAERAPEFVDDILTRRILDNFDSEAPELVSSVVPGVITVTQLTEILKGLAEEGLSIRNFDVIMQAVAENGPKASKERALLEDVRVALKRVISAHYARDGKIKVVTLDPSLDLVFMRAEHHAGILQPEYVRAIADNMMTFDLSDTRLLVSKGSRRIIRDYLRVRGCEATVLAHEEIVNEVRFEVLANISLESEAANDKLIEQLAA